ncbi:MAG: hypothetical protein EOO88_21810 [Pedobacter sp.]|nr:MAG: hypothetical protein EOO88_21810 [Pedobacter sp.]
MNLNRFHIDHRELWKAVLLFVVLVLAWPMVQGLVKSWDATAGYVDPGILVLVVLALITFLGMVFLSWWLLKRFWLEFGLPGLGGMVLRFNELELWMQLGFYWLCYALLLSAGVGCLIAVL